LLGPIPAGEDLLFSILEENHKPSFLEAIIVGVEPLVTWTVGPLTPGRYKIAATTRSGRSAHKYATSESRTSGRSYG